MLLIIARDRYNNLTLRPPFTSRSNRAQPSSLNLNLILPIALVKFVITVVDSTSPKNIHDFILLLERCIHNATESSVRVRRDW